MAERLATVPERGAPIVPRRLLRLAAGRFQLSNRLTLNQRVPGSSPGAPTKFTKIFRRAIVVKSPGLRVHAMSTEIVVLPSAPTALSARPRRRRRCHLQPVQDGAHRRVDRAGPGVRMRPQDAATRSWNSGRSRGGSRLAAASRTQRRRQAAARSSRCRLYVALRQRDPLGVFQ